MTQHIPRKRFGQHFLRDQHILDRIEHSLNINKNDNLVEIGPGQGALTQILIKKGAPLTAVEIDRDLAVILREKFKQDYFRLIEVDALKYNFGELEGPMRLIGNLPYNISTPILFHLLKYKDNIQDMHFMLQKEVIDRMISPPNQKSYGRLSVMLQYHCVAKSLFNIPPSAFSPPPKVQSAFVRLEPHPKENHPYGEVDIRTFEVVVRSAFSLRRKTIHNSLKPWLTQTDFQALQLDSNLRPENLGIQDFVNIANYIHKHPKTTIE